MTIRQTLIGSDIKAKNCHFFHYENGLDSEDILIPLPAAYADDTMFIHSPIVSQPILSSSNNWLCVDNSNFLISGISTLPTCSISITSSLSQIFISDLKNLFHNNSNLMYDLNIKDIIVNDTDIHFLGTSSFIPYKF